MIITAGGKDVAPQPLESDLKRHPLVGQAVVIGDRRPYLTALLTIDPETREQPAPNHPILQELEAHIAAVNSSRPSFEQVKKFELLDEELTIESGALTPTLKVKRRVVNERYQEQIEALYSGH